MLEEIDEYCRKSPAASKVLCQAEFFDELSRSAVMNVLRREPARPAGESS